MDQHTPAVQGAAELAGFASSSWHPHAYQARGIDWLCNCAAALFLPPGLGKTSITLAAFLKLRELGFAKRMLVLAPLKVCQTTWQAEPQKWAQFQGLRVGFAHGPKKMEVLMDPTLDIVCLNYDGIKWASLALQQLQIQGHGFEVVCFDELTYLKNTSSKRFKAMKPCLPLFKFRWGLTGTPAANGLMDLFGQVYCLDLGQRLGRFITHFRLKYFYQKPWDQFRYYITEEKQQELTAKLSDLAMYVKPEEWLELPEFLPIVREVVLPKELRTKYEYLEQEYLLKVEETVVTVANAGIMTSKLRQFTGGAIYDEVRNVLTLHTEKLENLEELVEELAGEPLMVAYQFDHERERLQARFKDALVLKGGMSEKATQEVVDKWNSGTERLLLVQPTSASRGLNLQFGGSAIAWYTMTYNLEEFIQLNARLYRQGQKNTVRCYLLSMKDTVDDQVAKVLAKKDVVQEDLFSALKLQIV
ncbi:MAG: DEAD/DEAH box helicase [Desulfurellales bacterium]|nr:MAG: DEAD/DEAH box helicase [Desulfurellales bacterium]